MNYLKTYESFEEDETILTLKDICIELEDEGFTIGFDTLGINTVLRIQKRTHDNLVDYSWREIDEIVKRVIDYLGNKLKSIRYIQNGSDGYKKIDIIRNPIGTCGQSTMKLYNLLIEFSE